MRKAVRMWDTATYWTDRAAGAIRHAKHKERPDVRARRIKGLEADKRKHDRVIQEAEKWLKLWTDCSREQDTALQASAALRIAAVCHLRLPRKVGDREDFNQNPSAYDALTGSFSNLYAPRTRDEVLTAALTSFPRSIAHHGRWLAHIENRLSYERTMLAAGGGTEADRTRPEKGGACRCWASPRGGWSYIQKVNRVSVTVLDTYHQGGPTFPRTMPFDKLTGLMSAAEVQAKRAAGLLLEAENRIEFFLLPEPPSPSPIQPPAPSPIQPTVEEAEPDSDPERSLRALWTAEGVSVERQDELIASVSAKAQLGAMVGPFRIGERIEAMRGTLKAGVAVVTAPQLFPTPAKLAARMAELAHIKPGQQVLEPSAGTGMLCEAIKTAQPAATVFAVEINPQLCELLCRKLASAADTQAGICRNVLQADFLERNGLGSFDRIVMNPPFANGDDIKHITRALSLLNPGGRMVALCANGPRQQDRLKPLVEQRGGLWEELPADTFSAAGTKVRTILLAITG